MIRIVRQEYRRFLVHDVFLVTDPVPKLWSISFTGELDFTIQHSLYIDSLTLVRVASQFSLKVRGKPIIRLYSRGWWLTRQSQVPQIKCS